MRDGWRTVRLSDGIGISHGYAFPGSEFATDPTFPTLVTPGNFRIGGGFRDAKLKTFSGAFPAEYLLNTGDVVVTMTDLSKAGDTLGYSAKVPPGRYLHNQRIGLVRIVDQAEFSLDYAYWLLRTNGYRSHVLGGATGSTVRHTSPRRILEYRFHLPPIPEQRRIAGVLGVLDDLIDTNQRLVSQCRELAADVFPTDGGGTVVFDEIAELGRQSVSHDEIESGTAYLGLEHFGTGGVGLLSVGTADAVASQKSVFNRGDVLYGKLRPYFRKVDRPSFNGVATSEAWVIRPKVGYSTEFVFSIVHSQEFTDWAALGSEGTRMPRAGWKHVSQ